MATDGLADDITAVGLAFLDAMPPSPVIDAGASVVARLWRELGKLGHVVVPLYSCPPGRAEARLLVDPGTIEDGEYPPHLDILGDRLGLRVVADADSSGRLARVLVEWEGRHGRKCRWGGADCVENFTDFGQLAREISGEVHP